MRATNLGTAKFPFSYLDPVTMITLAQVRLRICSGLLRLRTISGGLRCSIHNYLSSSRVNLELVSGVDDYSGAATRKMLPSLIFGIMKARPSERGSGCPRGSSTVTLRWHKNANVELPYLLYGLFPPMRCRCSRRSLHFSLIYSSQRLFTKTRVQADKGGWGNT